MSLLSDFDLSLETTVNRKQFKHFKNGSDPVLKKKKSPFLQPLSVRQSALQNEFVKMTCLL